MAYTGDDIMPLPYAMTVKELRIALRKKGDLIATVRLNDDAVIAAVCNKRAMLDELSHYNDHYVVQAERLPNGDLYIG